MKSISRDPRGIFEEWVNPKILKIPSKFKQNLKKKIKKNFQPWIYISKFRMFENNTENWLVILKKRNKNWKILANFWKIFWYFLYFFIFKCSKRKLSIFEVLGEYWRGLEEPRSDKIYSLGNWGVKKGPRPRGSRYEEFLVPSLPEFIFLAKIEMTFSRVVLAIRGSRVILQ